MASKEKIIKPKFQSFQDTILSLQKYWGKHGCIILQPYDIEVGAGTFHPATTLRSLGLSHGRQLMFSHQEDLLMEGMERTQIDYNIIINFKF